MFGCIGIGVGAALEVVAGFGATPYDVLFAGIAEAFPVSFGVAAACCAAFFYAIAWMFGKRPGPASLMVVLGVGPVANFTISAAPNDLPVAWSFTLFLVAGPILYAGASALLSAQLGPSWGEQMTLVVNEQVQKLNLAQSVWVFMGFCLAVGWALGGPVGWGTAVLWAQGGVLIPWCVNRFDSLPWNHQPIEPIVAEPVSSVR